MNNKIALLLACSLVSATVEAHENHEEQNHSVRDVVNSIGEQETKDVSMVDSFRHMFMDGKVSGQVRTIYAGYNQESIGADDTYVTAIGGILKYELAEFKGFNAGIAVYTSHDISFATGSGVQQNNELSSTSGSYTEMAQAYINYKYEDFNLRAGRQVLDTPLADSDDIRMIQNSFNAYVLSYDYLGIEFMAGHIASWQGVDAGLDVPWSDAGINGTNFGGVSYNDGLEFGIWYYNITQQTNATYIEFGGNYDVSRDVNVHAMVQYLDEKELSASGIAADIYGAMFEILAYDIGFGLAYNKSEKKAGHDSFSGFGGGTLFTNMDTMILNEITNDRDATAYVAGINYNIGNLGLLYAYGDFYGDKNSANVKAHIVEQDFNLEYNVNDEFLISLLYALTVDKKFDAKTSFDWQRTQVMINYNF